MLLTSMPDGSIDSNLDIRMFDFQQKADYESLRYHIHILDVALSSLDGYTSEELLKSSQITKSQRAPGESCPRNSEKSASPLEMIRNSLHVMYEKIGQ